MTIETSRKPVKPITDVTILFAGDSGDGMQITGSQFTFATALARNDLATLPDFPAEIRAPAGTTYGVSGYQLHFGSVEIRTPGDEVDLLVAMNAAALKVNLDRIRPGGLIIANTNSFEQRDLDLAGYSSNPLTDSSLTGFEVIPIELTKITREALSDSGLNQKDIDRCKNMLALGTAMWLYSLPLDSAVQFIERKFGKRPEIRDANLLVLKKGYHFGEHTELFTTRYEVKPAELPSGRYRAIRGNEALAIGLITAGARSGLDIFYGSYPITPASELLHELSKHKNFGIRTFQAEDEIAAIGAAIGASFGGGLGITATSGPGLALKAETLGLAVMTELPLVVIDVQRAGPSTGMPTKTEQSDLLQALHGRSGEAPLVVLSASTPGDCFDVAYEACRIAVKYMTPVILLSDGYIGNGAEPWRIPEIDDLPSFEPEFADSPNREIAGEKKFLPYVRDDVTLARPWARPGTPGLEHRIGGLEKQHETGNVSYDPGNHEYMVRLRAEKIARVANEIPETEINGPAEGDVLILGWGSTRGAIELAVERLRDRSMRVSSLHLRYLNPLPPDLGEVFARFDHLLVPELNNGQLVKVLRDRYLLPFTPLNKIQGMPFKASEIESAVFELFGTEAVA